MFARANANVSSGYAQWLLRLPFFAFLVSMLARILVFCLGQRLLHSMIKLLARMPDDAASTTAAFLSSKHGVRRALYAVLKKALGERQHNVANTE